MAFVIYCIELAKEDRDRAEAIMFNYCVDYKIDIKHLEYSCRSGMDSVQYWMTSKREDIFNAMVKELEENGIELF